MFMVIIGYYWYSFFSPGDSACSLREPVGFLLSDITQETKHDFVSLMYPGKKHVWYTAVSSCHLKN